jgi:hypothetical protein
MPLEEALEVNATEGFFWGPRRMMTASWAVRRRADHRDME